MLVEAITSIKISWIAAEPNNYPAGVHIIRLRRSLGNSPHEYHKVSHLDSLNTDDIIRTIQNTAICWTMGYTCTVSVWTEPVPDQLVLYTYMNLMKTTPENIQSHDSFNSFPPGQKGRHCTNDLFRCIFVNETFCILIKISLKIVPRVLINNNAALV